VRQVLHSGAYPRGFLAAGKAFSVFSERDFGLGGSWFPVQGSWLKVELKVES
jgi:hypothetical protein